MDAPGIVVSRRMWSRRVLAAFLSITAMAAGLPAIAQTPVALSIPSQDARPALMALCLRTGCAFAFAAEPERAYRTNAVKGVMPWPANSARQIFRPLSG